jgi:hypothetical protein
VPCRSRPRRRAEPFAFTFAFTRADPTPHAIVHPSTRTHRSRGQDWILTPLSFLVGLAAALSMTRTSAASPWLGRSRSRSHRSGTPPL